MPKPKKTPPKIEINNLSDVMTGYGIKESTKANPITANKVRMAKFLFIINHPMIINGTLQNITNTAIGR